MKRNFVIGLIITFLMTTVVCAQTVNRQIYGVATPGLYKYTLSTNTMDSYLLAVPTLSVADTIAGLAATQTFTNKTLTAPTITTSITPTSAGGSTIGTAALEWGHVYLTDSAVIYGQANQTNTLTSSSSGWTANLLFTGSLGFAAKNGASAGFVDIYEASGSGTNKFRLQSVPMAADISWSFPAAVPGGENYLVTASTAGVLTYTNPDTFSVKAGSSSIITVGALSAGSLTTGFTPVTVPLGGTGASTYALNGVLYGNAANAIGVTAIGAEGQILRVGATPFVPAWTTSTFASTYVIGGLLHAATANTIAALAPGAIGSFLMSNGNAAGLSYLTAGTANYVLVGAGVTSIPVWTAPTGTGAPVLANTPTLITPVLGAATGTSLATSAQNIFSATAGTAPVVARSATSTDDDLRLLPYAGGGGRFAGIVTSTDLTADRTYTLPNVSGNIITSGDTGTVANTMIAANAVTSAKLDEGTIKFAEIPLSNAQIKALFTTPIEVVATPGVGKVISFVDAIVIHDVGDADFATSHNVTINYKADGSGAAVSTTLADPFISGAVADKISTLKQLVTDITTADKTTQENQPLTIKASGNPITGTGVGRVKVWYRVFSTGL